LQPPSAPERICAVAPSCDLLRFIVNIRDTYCTIALSQTSHLFTAAFPTSVCNFSSCSALLAFKHHTLLHQQPTNATVSTQTHVACHRKRPPSIMLPSARPPPKSIHPKPNPYQGFKMSRSQHSPHSLHMPSSSSKLFQDKTDGTPPPLFQLTQLTQLTQPTPPLRLHTTRAKERAHRRAHTELLTPRQRCQHRAPPPPQPQSRLRAWGRGYFGLGYPRPQKGPEEGEREPRGAEGGR
jgi:hypothetical protein